MLSVLSTLRHVSAGSLLSNLFQRQLHYSELSNQQLEKTSVITCLEYIEEGIDRKTSERICL